MGHVLMENRNGLVVDRRLTSATGKAAREAAQQMIGKRAGGQRITLGADKGYDTKDFVNRLRKLNVSPHIARKANLPFLKTIEDFDFILQSSLRL